MLRGAIVVLLVAVTAAFAQSPPRPYGYRCGKGTPVPGQGCKCPAKLVENRTRENYAVCVAASPSANASSATAAIPCRQAAVAIRRLAARSPDATKHVPPQQVTMFLTRMEGLIAQRCARDRWTAEQASCFARAKTEAQMEVCGSRLTAAQTAAMRKPFEELERTFRKDSSP